MNPQLAGLRRRIGRTGDPLPVRPVAALLPLFAVTAVFGWWGWKQGAYFGVTFLPGAMVLLGLLAALLLFAPWPGALRGPARVSLAALLALAGWTLASALWSPAPDIAIEDAQRVLLYGVAFGLGLWLCLLLGRSMLLSLTPLAAAAGVVGVITLIALWTGDDAAEFFEFDATLRYPLGYRNAVAAYFLVAFFPAVVLAAGHELDWRIRGCLLAAATLMLELALLSQSRGAVFAIAIALAVLVAVHPARPRILVWLGLAIAPALLALPWLLDVFQHQGGNTAESLGPLRGACTAIALSSALSGVLGTALARRDPVIVLRAATSQLLNRALLALLALGLVAAVVVLARAEGGPAGFIERQADELTAGSPDLGERGSRFGLDFRSERGDLWRVALEDLAGNPITGEGAGGFRFSYLRERDSGIQPEDPHSVEMLMASELGLPGLLLFGCFAVAATAAGLRARRLGPSAAALAAGALAAAAYWLIHASVEWFWTWPGVTLPVVFGLGAVSAPLALSPRGELMPGLRRGLALAALLVGLALLPFLLSDSYTRDALRGWRSDLTRAYSDLALAADLNPFSDRPLVAEAVIAEEAGDPQRALRALSEAQDRQPDEWTLYYLEARILAQIDPAGAAGALRRAGELNPRGEEVEALEESLGQAP